MKDPGFVDPFLSTILTSTVLGRRNEGFSHGVLILLMF